MSFLVQDPVFAGLTRKTTIFGVQYEVVLFNAMVTGIAFVLSLNLWITLLILPLHGICSLVSFKDERIFSLLVLKLYSLSYCRNRHFWQGNSYSPLERENGF